MKVYGSAKLLDLLVSFSQRGFQLLDLSEVEVDLRLKVLPFVLELRVLFSLELKHLLHEVHVVLVLLKLQSAGLAAVQPKSGVPRPLLQLLVVGLKLLQAMSEFFLQVL